MPSSSSRMRIVQLCPYGMEQPGGISSHVRDLSRALVDLGHDVTTIAPRPERAAGSLVEIGPSHRVVKVSGAVTLAFNKTTFQITYAGRADRKLLAEVMARECDVIHYHSIWSPFLPWQVFARARAPAVATFHDVPPEGRVGNFQRRVYPFITRRLLPRLDGIILASRVLESHIDMSLTRAACILPPCIDLSRFGPDRPPARRFDDDRINILYLGRLEPRKGPMVLLEAYRTLCAEGLPVRLLVAGDGSERGLVTDFVAQNHLPDVVMIGAVRGEDTPGWYTAADIFCAPSLYGEGFGLVLLEAMASGTPVVAADNPGYSTVVTEETGQVLAPRGDSAALAARLRGLVLDAGLRRSMGVRGIAAAARYDVRTLAPEFINLYAKAIGRGRAQEPA